MGNSSAVIATNKSSKEYCLKKSNTSTSLSRVSSFYSGVFSLSSSDRNNNKPVSSKNLKDDAFSYRSKIDATKLLMKTEDFRGSFKHHLELLGKAPFICCFQRLERLRKFLVHYQFALLTSGASLPNASLVCDTDELESVWIHSHGMITSVRETSDLIKEFEATLKESSCVLSSSDCKNWTKRILSLQETLLSYLFDEFEDFVEQNACRSSGESVVTATFTVSNKFEDAFH